MLNRSLRRADRRAHHPLGEADLITTFIIFPLFAHHLSYVPATIASFAVLQYCVPIDENRTRVSHIHLLEMRNSNMHSENIWIQLITLPKFLDNLLLPKELPNQTKLAL